MNDLQTVLIWMAGPGIAAISAFVLERLAPVQSLSSSGKAIVAVTVALLAGMLAVAAQQIIIPNAELVQVLNPYVAVIVPAVSLLVQQLTHGVQKARQIA
jgi:hypothetical protein